MKTPTGSAVEIGVIGAGGRGNWNGDFFVNQGGARIAALADALVDRPGGRLEQQVGEFRESGRPPRR